MSREVGRPSKLTPEVQEKICQILRGGNFKNVACEYAGVSQRVFREWMKKGAEGEQPYEDFRRAVIEAEKSAEIRAVGLIIKAAQEDPRHAQWWLSHRFPERWADRQRQELRAQHKVRLESPLKDVPNEDILQFVRTNGGTKPED